MARSKLRWQAKMAYLELMRPLPDALAVQLDYFRVFGALPNLREPRLFSEKIQAWKLRDRDSRLPVVVDKIRVKDFVAERLGADWIIPTYWSGAEVTEAILRGVQKPSIMKAAHSSAQLVFLNEDTDLAAAARTANGWRSYDHHVIHREWAYKDVPREILIEARIGGERAPPDYKFWVVDGQTQFIQFDQDRFEHHSRQFYTPDWRLLDITMMYPGANVPVAAPPHLREMLAAAHVLANDFRFARVDLYDTDERPLFGEITFAPEGGLCRFQPPEVNRALGEIWSYPAPRDDTRRAASIAERFPPKSRG